MVEESKEKTGGSAGTGKDQEGSLPPFGLAEDVLQPESQDSQPNAPVSRGNGDGAGGGESNGETDMQLVTFFLDKEEYGIPIFQVQEINRVGEITRVPNAPDHVTGVINLRGKIVPVIELKKRLRLGQTKIDKDSRIVMVEYGSKILGLIVDRVAQVLKLSSLQIEKAPEEVVRVDENYVKGLGKIDERLVIILEIDKVVGDNGDTAKRQQTS